MKTWEILKRIDEKGIECVGETYKLTKVNDGVRVGEVGMVIEISKFMNIIALADLKGRRVDWITGQEEWEKIEKEYYFQDEFIAKTNPKLSFLTLDKYSNSFFLSYKDGDSMFFQTKFTKAEINELGIPTSKYNMFKVEK